MHPPTRAAREEGETLLELIVAVAIMGIALVAIIGGVGTSILVSDIHRKQSTAGAYVRDYAEAIENYVARGNYIDCATSTSYVGSTVGFTVPAGYTATVSSAQTWSGAGWVSCGADIGIQKITLEISSTDERAIEQLTMVLRRCTLSGAQCE